jgi:hypothetical protein
MKTRILVLYLAFSLIIVAGCKKSSNNTVTATFKADTAFSVVQANAFPNFVSWSSIAIDATGNKIFYYYPDVAEGFKIDLYDIATKGSATIYKHFTQSGLSSWSTSNGSEGMRLRYFGNTYDGNKLIIPGGATNTFIVEVRVNTDYSTHFGKIDDIPATANGINVYDAYDADLVKTATGNTISVVSMYNSVYTLGDAFPAFAVSTTSHGSSIVGTPGGKEYVFCGSNKSLELYDNGSFIRAVTLTSGETQLQMDSKNRIYAYQGSVIYRFSADLLSKEEFPVKGTLSGYRNAAMVLKEMPGYVQVYSFDQHDLIGMRLPM